MLRIHQEDSSDGGILPTRRTKRGVARVKPTWQPEMEHLEIRITPATRTWAGGVDDLWSRAANWAENAAPTDGDDLVFPSDATRFSASNDLAAGTSIASISIDGANYVLAGNSIILGGLLSTTYSSGTSTSELDIQMDGGNVSVATGGQLALGGVLSGSTGLTIDGGGTLELSGLGANTYSGITSVTAGTLLLSKSGVVAIPGPLEIGDGSGTDVVRLTSPDQIDDAASVFLGVGGLLDLNDNSDAIGALELDGATVSTGTGTLTLGGDVTSYANAITSVISGKLDLGGATRTFTVGDMASADPDLSITADISGTGAGIVKEGSGSVLSLSGNNTYDGATDLNDGYLAISNANALGATTAGTTVADGASLILSGGISLAAEPFTINGSGVGGTGAIYSPNGSNGLPGAIALGSNSSISVEAGSTLDLSGVISGSFGVTKDGAGTLRYSGSSANTYNDTTTINAGTLALAKPDGVISANGSVIVGDNATAATLVLEGDDQFWAGSEVTVNEGSTFDVGTHETHISNLNLRGATTQIDGGGVLYLFAGMTSTVASTGEMSNIQGLGALEIDNSYIFFTVADDPTLDVDLRISTVLQGSQASSALYKQGAGVLALSGANTYGGDTQVSVGAIRVESDAALGATSAGTTIASGASVYFNGTGLNIAEDFTDVAGTGLGGDNLFRVVSGDATLTGNLTLTGDIGIGAADGSTLTINGTIDDDASTFGLEILNGATGRTVLGGNNLFDGDVFVYSGFLRATSDGALGDQATASLVDIQSGASLELAGGIGLSSTKTLGISGNTVANSSKIINVSGDNLIHGDIGISGGNNESIDVAGGTTLTLTGALSGSMDLDKNGTGTLVLDGSSTHTGNLNVGDGRLMVQGNYSSSNSVFVDGTLGGLGELPDVSISSIGTLSPGNSPSVLATGDLSQTGGSTYRVDIDGTNAGSEYDQTQVTGTVDLGGATLSIDLGFWSASGDVFTIIDNDGADAVTGTFDGLAEGATVTIGSQQFTISYVGGDGNDVTLTALLRIANWTGLGGDNNWSTGANWASGIAPTAGDQLVFAAGASRLASVNNFPDGTTFDSIVIEGSGYTFTGNQIQISNGITTTYASGTSILGTSIILFGPQTVTVAAGGNLALSGVLYSLGGSLMTKDGAGVLTIGSDNSAAFVGGLTIDAGAVAVFGDGSNLGTGPVTVTPGATLALQGGITLSNTLSIGGTGVTGAGAVVSSGSANELSGDITLSADALVVASNSLSLSGAIGGAFGIATAGSGMISLVGSASNTYTGTTTAGVSFLILAKTGGAEAIAGDLVISPDSYVELGEDEQVSDAATVTFSGPGAIFGLNGRTETLGPLDFTGGTLTTGVGQLILAGDVTTNAASARAAINGNIDLGGATRTFTVADGAASDDFDVQATVVSGTGAGITKLGAGRMVLGGSNTYDGTTAVNAGTLVARGSNALGSTAGSTTIDGATLEVFGVGVMAAEDLVFTGGTLVGNGGAVNILPGTITLASGSTTFSAATSTRLNLTGVISGSNADVLTIGDAANLGTVALSATNTFNNAIDVQYGTLVAASDAAFGGTTNGISSVAAGATVAVEGGVTIAEAIDSLAGSGAGGLGALRSISGNNTWSGAITLGSDASIGVDSDGNLNVSGSLAGTAGQELSKVGPGTLRLSNTGNEAALLGGITVSGGRLSISADDALSAGTITLGTGATLEVGAAITIDNAIALAGSAMIDHSAALTLSGLLSGAGLLTVGGAGALTLTNTGNEAGASGGLFVNSGSLSFADDDALPSGTIILAGGTTLASTGLTVSTIDNDISLVGDATVSITATTTFSGLLSGASTLTKVGGGALTLTNTGNEAAFTGGLNISAFSVLAGSDDALPAGTITLGANSTLFLTAAMSVDNNITLNGAATILNSANVTLSGLLSGSSTLTKSGSGTLTLTNTGNEAAFTGGMTSNAGTLSVADDDALPGGTLTFSGAFFSLTADTTIDNPIVLTVAATPISVSAGVTATLSGNISETGGSQAINKSLAGTLILTGTNTYSGNTNLNAGTVSVAGSSNLGSGTIRFNQSNPTLLVTAAGTITNPIYLNVPGTVNHANDLTLSGVISGTSNFTKSGAGTLTLSATSTYTGTTTISAGKVLVDGSIAASSGVTVSSGAILGGSGTLPALTANGGGTVAPGNSPGILHAGDTTLNGNAIFDVELDGTTVGSQYDQLDVTGTVTLNGPILSVSLGFTSALGDAFTIINNDGSDAVSGTFLNLAEGEIFTQGGRAYQISYVGGDGNDVTLTDIATTTISVTSDSATSTYGDSLTFAAIVTASEGTATGSVSFYAGATLLGTGIIDGTGLATYTTTTMAASATAYAITAVYAGTPSFIGSTSSTYDQTVNQAVLTVTADDLGRVYGDANPTLTATFAGFKNGETLATSGVTGSASLSTLADPTSPVAGSPYAIVASAGTLDAGNYSFSFVDGELTITKATLSVTSHDYGRVYGDANPTLAATLSGFKNGETLATSDVTGTAGLSTSATPTSPVAGSPYAITASLGTLASGNYDFSFLDGELVIIKATLTVTADDASRAYGDANPTLTATYAGFKNGETLATSGVTGSVSLSTLAGPTSPVAGSPYAIVASLGNLAASNYDFSFVDGELTVTKATLTVTADDLSRVYGDANPTLTATISGFKNGENFGTSGVTGVEGLSTSATPSSPVAGGPYAIVASAGTLAASNYDFSFIDGELTVTKATLSVTADDASRVYGDANPSFTATFAGFKNGETLGTSGVTGSAGLNTSATPSSPVAGGSPYAIIAASGSLASGNYDFTYVDGELTITRAMLTITADDKFRDYGDPNPPLTASYSGFKNGETLATSGVTGSPDLSTTAGPLSTVEGNPYPITIDVGSLAADNYDFGLIGGLLYIDTTPTLTNLTTTVNPGVFGQSITLVASVLPTVPSDVDPTGTVVFKDGGTTIATVSVDSLGFASFTTSGLAVGGHSFTAEYLGDSSFLSSVSTPFDQSIARAATTTSLISSADPSTFGQSVTFVATVSVASPGAGSPTGTVSFFDGETLIGSAALSDGSASFTLDSMAVGTHSISAVYSGDDSFDGATSSAVSQSVGKSSPGLAVVTSGPTVNGQPITLTANVAPSLGDATGTVTFMDGFTVLGTVSLSGNSASITVPLSAGSHAITATYSGDGSFNGASTSTMAVVAQSQTVAVVTSSSPTAVFGQFVAYTATILPANPGAGTPTGFVVFRDGSTIIGSSALVNGSASLVIAASGVGEGHPITVSYEGDADFVASGSAAMNQMVVNADTTTYMAITPAAQGRTRGYLISLGVATNLPGGGAPTGQIVVYALSKPYKVLTLNNGLASMFVSRATAKRLGFFAARYMGDSGRNGSVSPIFGVNGSPIKAALRPMRAFRTR